MIEFHPTLNAAVHGQHRRDLLREAARSRLIAELPAQTHRHTPRQRVAWWVRVTAYVSGHSAVAQA